MHLKYIYPELTTFSLFLEIQRHQEIQMPRILWERLRDTQALALALSSFHVRLHDTWNGYKQSLVSMMHNFFLHSVKVETTHRDS